MQSASKHAESRRSWFGDLKQMVKEDLEKSVPVRTHFPYHLGALALVFFVFQIITGVLLMLYYRPSAEEAYTSMAVIADEVSLGWLLQGLHRWCTDLLLVLVLLHMARVYLVRAYRGLRSLNWVVGLLLLLCVLAFAFTGTLLPWDQYAFWITASARVVVADIPLLGNVLLRILWGGETGEDTLWRFYVFHVGILPWVTGMFLSFHMLMIWHLGVQTVPTRAAKRTPFFPDFLISLSMAILILFGLLLVGAVVFPGELGDPVNPLLPLVGATPRWYFMPLHELLRHFSGAGVAVIVTGFFILLCLVPVFDRSPQEGFWRRVLVWLLGIIVVAVWFLIGLRGYLY